MVVKFTSVLLLFALGSLPAAAQDAAPSLKIPTIVFAGAAAADWTTTYAALASGEFRECDPLLTFTKNRPVPTVVFGAALDVAAVWAWRRAVGRRHPKLAALGLYVAAGLQASIAARNLHRVRTP